jgi:hypothetical protein
MLIISIQVEEVVPMNVMYNKLKEHVGHDIECVQYGNFGYQGEPQNVAIECNDCNEVIISYDLDEE